MLDVVTEKCAVEVWHRLQMELFAASPYIYTYILKGLGSWDLAPKVYMVCKWSRRKTNDDGNVERTLSGTDRYNWRVVWLCVDSGCNECWKSRHQLKQLSQVNY